MNPLHWNPIVGCALASPGCSLCVAMRAGGPMTVPGADGPVWSGRVSLNEGLLDLPATLRQSVSIAICTRSDLFYEGIPDAWIDRMLDVVEDTPQHSYQVLTKRPARARAIADRREGLPSNLLVGTSAERQQEADARIPELLATSAPGGRFLAFYPLLGPIELRPLLKSLGYASASVSFAGIGGEVERPPNRAWAWALTGELSALGIPVKIARPDREAA